MTALPAVGRQARTWWRQVRPRVRNCQRVDRVAIWLARHRCGPAAVLLWKAAGLW
jgi:hypothetical protein